MIGNEDAQRDRLMRDIDPNGPAHDPNGAMNHTMLYLVMGQDNARGTILFEAPWTEPDGRIRVSWDKAGQQQIFTRMNEECAGTRARCAATSSPIQPGACSTSAT